MYICCVSSTSYVYYEISDEPTINTQEIAENGYEKWESYYYGKEKNHLFSNFNKNYLLSTDEGVAVYTRVCVCVCARLEI